MTINIKRTGNFTSGSRVRVFGSPLGKVKFITTLGTPLPLPLTQYYNSYFLSLATGSSGDSYISGYFYELDSQFNVGALWRVDSGNLLSGTTLQVYDDSSDFIYAANTTFPFFSLETSDGNVALFGYANYLGSGSAGCLWKVDTSTHHVSATILPAPRAATAYYHGITEDRNGNIFCAATDGGSPGSTFLWVVDNLGSVSSTYITKNSPVSFFYNNGVYNHNQISADPKTDNVWVYGAVETLGYATSSLWKFENGNVSGTLLGVGASQYEGNNPFDIAFGSNDEIWACGLKSTSGVTDAIVWQLLTGSGYVTSTILSNPNPGYSAGAYKILSSSYDGTLRVLGYYIDAWRTPILWTLS